MDLNERITSIPPSLTLAVGSKAKAYAAAGEDVCNFGAGEPDFDTPEHIKMAAAQALERGETKYSPASGLAALREEIAAMLSRENGLDYAPDQIIVSNGAKHSLFNVVMALCRPGDEVLIPAPYWLSYPEMVRIAGATPVPVHASEQDGFKVSVDALEAATTDRTKALIVNSPSNPTGAVYERDELLALAEFAVGRGLYIISDEIYRKILYDGRTHVSIGTLSAAIFENTITVDGFSKAFSMTGWRLGFFAGPEPLVKAVGALQSHSTSGPNTFAQYGALAALRGPQECVSDMVVEFAKRRDYLFERLRSISGVTCVKPGGAFYMLPTISAAGLSSAAFAEKLLDDKKVAVVPGSAFGAEGTVRISYACAMETIEKGMDRLDAFMSKL